MTIATKKIAVKVNSRRGIIRLEQEILSHSNIMKIMQKRKFIIKIQLKKLCKKTIIKALHESHIDINRLIS